MVLLELGTALCIWMLGRELSPRRRFLAPVLFLAATSLSFRYLFDRFDVAVAFVFAASVLLAVRSRLLEAAALAAAGWWLKIVPVLLLPLLAVRAHTGKRLAVAGGSIAGFAAVAGLSAWWLGPPSLTGFLAHHAGRGIHIESVPGSVLLLLEWAGMPVEVVNRFGCDEAVSAVTEPLSRLIPFVVVGLQLAIAGILLVRRTLDGPGARATIDAALLLVLAFLVTNKVLSPQHLCWFYPLASLRIAAGRAGRRESALWAWILGVTSALYPWFVDEMGNAWWAVLPIGLRSAALIAAAACIAGSLLRNPPVRATQEPARRFG